MEWQQVSQVLQGPVSILLGAACALLWRELKAERAARAAEQNARIEDLKSLLKPKP
jgi:hypothetical protein